MKQVPAIAAVMTPFPYSIDMDDDVRAASSMMAKHDVRHLPVTKNHQLVGVLSDRDVLLARSLGHHGEQSSVRSVCTPEPYVVDLHTRLDEVLLEMARQHIDCALVKREGKLAGILTTTDVCRLFGEHLQQHLPPSEPGDVA
jgi:acetoin utilization protein AcuB